MAAQQQKRITLGNAALRVMIRICREEKQPCRVSTKNNNIAAVYHHLGLYILSWLWNFRGAYIVFLEVAHIAQHADPYQHGAGAQEDAADVITRQSLTKQGFVIEIF